MRRARHLLAAALLVGVGSLSAFAQQSHVVDPAAVAGVVRDHAERVEADRAAIRETSPIGRRQRFQRRPIIIGLLVLILLAGGRCFVRTTPA